MLKLLMSQYTKLFASVLLYVTPLKEHERSVAADIFIVSAKAVLCAVTLTMLMTVFVLILRHPCV